MLSGSSRQPPCDNKTLHSCEDSGGTHSRMALAKFPRSEPDRPYARRGGRTGYAKEETEWKIRVTKAQVRARIEEIGILPAIRVSTPERARFALEALHRAGISLAEVTMTVPKGCDVIAQMSKILPGMVIGAGTVLDVETAQRALDAGAQFLTSPGFVPEVVEFALTKNVVVFPGAMTPTEVVTAWKAGSDFVKIFPCDQLGGAQYIRTLRRPLPHIPLIASGGVNQQTAMDFIVAGATVLGIGGQLVPQEALASRNGTQIHELARRFLEMVAEGREQRENLE
jgi:2-dehydro-3-deoxyphosphogluconate aldolase / (4S)-4-hydroxy-2-oxoglutarate aldolase